MWSVDRLLWELHKKDLNIVNKICHQNKQLLYQQTCHLKILRLHFLILLNRNENGAWPSSVYHKHHSRLHKNLLPFWRGQIRACFFQRHFNHSLLFIPPSMKDPVFYGPSFSPSPLDKLRSLALNMLELLTICKVGLLGPRETHDLRFRSGFRCWQDYPESPVGQAKWVILFVILADLMMKGLPANQSIAWYWILVILV